MRHDQIKKCQSGELCTKFRNGNKMLVKITKLKDILLKGNKKGKYGIMLCRDEKCGLK